MKVIFYGRLADTIAREVEIDIATPCTFGDLRFRLHREFPGRGLSDGRIRACVSGTIIADDAALRTDQPVEILAPVSGG